MNIRTPTAFLILFLGLSFGARAQTGVVRSNGLPLPGATIRATRGERSLVTVTDEEGRYRLDGLADGNWMFEVQMFRFETARKEVTVGGAANLEWNLALKPLVTATAPAPTPARAPPAVPRGPGPQTARRGAPARGPQARRPGATQQPAAVPELTNQLEGPVDNGAAGAQDLPGNVQSDSANEAFLLSGTLSRGLQQVGGDPGGGMGFGRPPSGAFGDNSGVPGMSDTGVPGAPGGQGANAPGFGGAGGGRGPGGGGFGGGMGGRGGVGGGMGGRGGPGGRQGPMARGRGPGNTDNGLMGNRRNRGQQSLHGMFNVVLHNSALDASPFAVNGQTVAKPSYAQERYSLQIGGPLMIPKLFRLQNTTFNFNYTQNVADNLSRQIGTVPTLLERGGDFSLSNGIVYNPTNGAPFPGNRIPVSSINPIAAGLLQFIPNPNQTGSCAVSSATSCIAQNYQFTATPPNNNHSIGLRLGQSFSRKDRVALNFQMQSRSSVSPQIFGFLDSASGDGFSTSLSWTHTFAPRIFNMASVSFNRNSTNALPWFANGVDVASQLGIHGVSDNPLNYGPPNLSFTNYAGLTDGSASLSRIQSTTLHEAFTWMRGKHSLSFGAALTRRQTNNKTDSNGRGSFSFTGLATSAVDANGQPVAGTGYDFADFLLGLPNSSSIRYGDTTTYFRSTDYSFFAQDDWRVRSNLSFNFGLRYEYFGVPYEKYGREANLDVASYFSAVSVVVPGANGPYTGLFPQGLVNPDRNNFAPRAALAWRPTAKSKTLVRAGYGWYYNGAAYNGFARNLAAQPPFANSNSIITSTAGLLTLADGFTLTPAGKTVNNTWAIDRYYRVPYAQSWNVLIQREFSGRLVLQASYLGTKGTRLDTQRLPNRAAPGSPLTAEQRRLIGNATGFTYEDSDASSIYHAARLTLNRRFSRGVSFSLDYLFSKSIDDASTFGGGVAQNDQNIRAERSLSNFDRRHTLSANYVLTSPYGHNNRLLAHHELARKLLEDWTLNGGLSAQTGTPLNPKVAGNLTDSAGTGANGTTRPDATGLAVNSGSGYFNTAAFALPLAGQFGDAGRNTIPGPGSVTLNASFGRSFGLGERRALEFRFDGNNVLNQVNIRGIGVTLNSASYGLPLTAGAMRSLSVTARFRF